VGADGPVIVDTGPPGSHRAFLDYLARLGYGPGDVIALVVTHGDWDHAGSLGALQRETGAPAVVPEAEIPLVEGRVDHATRIQLHTWAARLWKPIYRVLTRVVRAPEPVKVDFPLLPGADRVPGGLRPVPTPGHTPGHTSYYDPERGVLFAGDALVNTRGLSTPLPIVTEDMAQARDSVKRLAVLSFEVACFGHGPPITHNAAEEVRRLAARLEKAG
jgi:glyoxylase-like metal-dependent hydrolase (beta-lactamase superfamily II)